MKQLETLATLWPEMPHYEVFAKDPRINAIRLNTAMTSVEELPEIIKKGLDKSFGTPLFFDIKGRQLRIEKVIPNDQNLELLLNHPISVKAPTMVSFKSGADYAMLDRVDGNYLRFKGGPHYNVIEGESLQIRDESLKIHGPLFTEKQLNYIAIAEAAGIEQYMLSYVGSMNEINEFRRYVGNKPIMAKIEDMKGVRFAESYVKQDNLGLLAARGDLFVEVDKPHDIIKPVRTIVERDPDAILGSRILLSVTNEPIPSCADLFELDSLMNMGYYRFMFCDGLCLQEEPLNRAVSILHAAWNEREEQFQPGLGTKLMKLFYSGAA